MELLKIWCVFNTMCRFSYTGIGLFERVLILCTDSYVMDLLQCSVFLILCTDSYIMELQKV